MVSSSSITSSVLIWLPITMVMINAINMMKKVVRGKFEMVSPHFLVVVVILCLIDIIFCFFSV